MNKKYWGRMIIISALVASQDIAGTNGLAQSLIASNERPGSATNASEAPKLTSLVFKYFDQHTGMTVDQAVAFALQHNGELLAARKEIEAASALVKQAALRANPMVEASGAKTVSGTDNNLIIQGTLPLELGGRRSARIKVAERELELRRQDVSNRERLLAADVRTKFGEALAAIFKLGFDQDVIDTSESSY